MFLISFESFITVATFSDCRKKIIQKCSRISFSGYIDFFQVVTHSLLRLPNWFTVQVVGRFWSSALIFTACIFILFLVFEIWPLITIMEKLWWLKFEMFVFQTKRLSQCLQRRFCRFQPSQINKIRDKYWNRSMFNEQWHLFLKK